MSEFPVIRAAVVQATPVLLCCQRCIDALEPWVEQAAGAGAQLVLFPEAFVPGYPRGFGFGAVVGSRSEQGRDLWARYWAESIEVPGPDTERIGSLAATHRVWLAIGVIERAGGTLYCTLLYFGPDGALLGKHRKLKPTGSERLIWGEGDGTTLGVVECAGARVGGLICWENYMPLARMAMYEQGVQVYLAPTADSRDTWQASLRHIALEGRCFVLGCNQFLRRQDYPDDLLALDEAESISQVACRGGSAIYSPLGECLAGPLFDQQGMLVADLDLSEVVRGKYDFDVVGHYARPDVFRFELRETDSRECGGEPARDEPEPPCEP